MLSRIRKTLLLSTILFTVIYPFSGCQKEKEKTDFSASTLVEWFGRKEKTVLSKLDIHPKNDIQREEYNHSQKTILLNKKWQYEGSPAEITLLFQKDIFFGVTYLFPNEAETGFTWAKSVCSSIAEKQGVPSTYPSLPDRLLDLTLEDFQKETAAVWREYWEIPDKQNLIHRLKPNAEDTETLKLELRLERIPADKTASALVTFRYNIY